jgi:cell wall assembly regulator SMI1
MQEIWLRIETWLEANAPQIIEVLQPGASDAQIGELVSFAIAIEY